MAAIVTVRRYSCATSVQLEGDEGVLLFEWPFFMRQGDRAIELQVAINSGIVGFQVDGDVVDRSTISSNALVTVDISDKAIGELCGKIYSRSNGTSISLLEAHMSALEVR